MTKKFLDRAYDHAPGKAAASFYDEWAASYEKELAEGLYVTPLRCASALALHAPNKDRPILDLGCGTGLAGAALHGSGFTQIDGWDPSAQMLSHADKRQIYRALRQIDPEEPLSAPADTYFAVNAAGVLSPGLAPPEAFDQILGFICPGGLICFSLNDHAIEDGAHLRKLDTLITDSAVKVLHKEYGEHIPARNLKAWVYVIAKA